MNIEHSGKYEGPKLSKLVPKTMYDNRIINIENYIKPGLEYNSKPLEERGWKLIIDPTSLDLEKDINSILQSNIEFD